MDDSTRGLSVPSDADVGLSAASVAREASLPNAAGSSTTPWRIEIGGRLHEPRRWWVVFGWAAFLVAVATSIAAAAGHTGAPLVATGASFALLLLPYLAFAFTSIARDVAEWYGAHSARLWTIPLAALAVYVFYALRTDCFSWSSFLRLGAFVGLPTAVLQHAGRRPGVVWQDWLAIFLIWIPFDTSWLYRVWAWPAGEGAYIFNVALAVGLGVSLFVCWRGHGGINFRLRMTGRDVVFVAAALAGFMAIALPIGLASGFIAINPQLELGKVALAPLAIFFFIAIPEELMFRGLFQNLLRQKLGRPIWAIVIASLFFGATHLNNEPLMDWRFFLLASIAGLFYGWAYERTKSLMAPAVLHAAVDVIWSLFFHV